ncbi:hypothetical protein [Methanobrevibacter sp.]|uniref:hypothetical protein n=1 Tax=Methanobrevibacter sp. TaxID=66852 RepID=UPI0039766659
MQFLIPFDQLHVTVSMIVFKLSTGVILFTEAVFPYLLVMFTIFNIKSDKIPRQNKEILLNYYRQLTNMCCKLKSNISADSFL